MTSFIKGCNTFYFFRQFQKHYFSAVVATVLFSSESRRRLISTKSWHHNSSNCRRFAPDITYFTPKKISTPGCAQRFRNYVYSTQYQRSRMFRDDILKGLDDTQVKLMEEECQLVDIRDKNIGFASKKTCHLLENINKGMLHRAFSVFLFNTKGELLLQQRAETKITFPDHFTNTCCSHPLNFAAELDESEAIGVKRAAQRKLKHELGIEPIQVPIKDFQYLTRILYKAENVPKDDKWGEHEIDYILIIQKNVDVVPNPNEVKTYRYVSQQELKNIIATADTQGIVLTPWFQLIAHNFLFKWWNNLDNISSQADRDTIHRMV